MVCKLSEPYKSKCTRGVSYIRKGINTPATPSPIPHGLKSTVARYATSATSLFGRDLLTADQDNVLIPLGSLLPIPDDGRGVSKRGVQSFDWCC